MKSAATRRTKVLRSFGILFGVGVTAIIGLLFLEEARGKKAWDAYRISRETVGERFDWQSQIPKEIPDDENFGAAPVIKDQGYAKIDLLGLEGLDRERYQNTLGWEAGKAWHFADFFSSEIPETEAIARIQKALADWEPTLTEIADAAARPRCRFLIDYTAGPNMNIGPLFHLNEVVTALTWRGVLHAREGRPTEALADYALCLRLVRHMDSLPLLLGWLFELGLYQECQQILWEGLRAGLWNEDQLSEAERLVDSLDLQTTFFRHAREERALFSAWLLASIAKKAGDGHGEGLITYPKGWLYQNLIRYNRQLDEWLFLPSEAIHFPAIQKAQNVFVDQARRRAWSRNHPYRVIADPSVIQVYSIVLQTLRSQVIHDFTKVAIALERERRTKGAYPESLIEPANDPFSNAAYHYELKSDGSYRLYSIGPNGLDDHGLARAHVELGDWVWQYESEGLTSADFYETPTQP